MHEGMKAWGGGGRRRTCRKGRGGVGSRASGDRSCTPSLGPGPGIEARARPEPAESRERCIKEAEKSTQTGNARGNRFYSDQQGSAAGRRRQGACSEGQ